MSDESFLRAVTRRLEAARFAVEAFSSAEAFLARRSSAPGGVVVDLRMQGQGGLERQDALAQGEDPLPVVFLTGHGRRPDARRGRLTPGAADR